MTDLNDERSVEELAARALDTSLPKARWTHAAHFALALWVLRHRAEFAAPDAFRNIILRLNEAHGTPNTNSEGYHHTITIASLRAARAVLEEVDAAMPLHRVLEQLLSGPFGRSDWILAYWSRELLFSIEARRAWTEPDLKALPF